MEELSKDTAGPNAAMAVLGLDFATSVAPTDTSTSIVIHPDRSKQIATGRSSVATFLDVEYAGPSIDSAHRRSLQMDILAPGADALFPLIVFVTGGGFATDNKASALGPRTYLAEAGFVVASVEYRTARDGATYVDGVSDIKSAVRFLRSKASLYSIDPARVGVWGQSAGGYLAAMAAMTNGDPRYETGPNLEQSSMVDAVADQFGPSDLSRADDDFNKERRQSQPERRRLYVRGFEPDGSLSDQESSPTNHPAPFGVRFLLMHGSADRLISPSQTLLLHEHLLRSGVESSRYVLEDADHGDLSFLGDREAGLAWSSTDTMDLVVRFFADALR